MDQINCKKSTVTNVTEENMTPEYLQRKLYFLVDQLKQMQSNLPE